MNIVLYDILVSNKCYTHGIGRVSDKETLRKFSSILELGGLYSKAKLRKMGIIVDGKVSGNIRITNDAFISLFDPSTPGIEKSLLSPKYRLRFPFDTDVIFFMVDSSVESLMNAKRNQFDYTEVNVKDFIPMEYFSGIIIPNDPTLLSNIEEILTEHNLELPIFDFEGNFINTDKMNRD
ncbi:MAG: hypothetical protein E7161_00035 [Firmicutes bacterium]|nr:hypothetical protein [Bacillota bacterium]